MCHECRPNRRQHAVSMQRFQAAVMERRRPQAIRQVHAKHDTQQCFLPSATAATERHSAQAEFRDVCHLTHSLINMSYHRRAALATSPVWWSTTPVGCAALNVGHFTYTQESGMRLCMSTREEPYSILLNATVE